MFYNCLDIYYLQHIIMKVKGHISAIFFKSNLRVDNKKVLYFQQRNVNF